MKEVWMRVIDQDQCQKMLRRTKLGEYFQLDAHSFICAGGQVDKDMCTVSFLCQIIKILYVLTLRVMVEVP